MPALTYQNVRLASGRHRAPDEGACVMELVSMLADEPFSDHPRTACPVIATFLRSYNDLAADAERQHLLAVASRIVGSRQPTAERARIARCQAVVREIYAGRPRWWRCLAWLARWPAVSPSGCAPSDDVLARNRLCWHLAVLLRSEPGSSARVLALVEELVAIGEPASVAPWGPVAPPAPRRSGFTAV